MQILVNVNQAEALRNGFDAPSSTMSIEINPTNLSQEIRDWIADRLKDGHKLPITIIRPDLTGLVLSIHKAMEAEKEEQIKKVENQQRINNEILAAVEKFKADNETMEYCEFFNNQRVCETIPIRPSIILFRGESSEVHDIVDRLTKKIDAQRAPRIQWVKDRIAELRQAAQQKIKDEYDALYDRLDASLRGRYEDDYLDRKTIENAMRDLICSDAGYESPYIIRLHYDRLETLTAGEHEQFQKAWKAMPGGAVIEAVLGYDANGENEVKLLQINLPSRGGLTAYVNLPLE